MSYDYYLMVDYREKDLYLLLEKHLELKYSNLNFELSKNNLDIGDIILLDSNKEILVIIERKSLNDLLSSIKDGRYENQSHRLIQHPLKNHNILYLIEGNLSLPGIDDSEKNMIFSSIISLNLFKGFSVLRTMNKIESAQLIARMLYKYIKDSNKIPNDTCNNELHVSSLKKMKKNNDITRDNINICFLSQIPGINEKTANSINNYFENCSFDIMIQRIREEPNILENIKINTNNKFRKISKNNIEKIIEFLL
tara:strand:+ start:135 stop:893 length:759 start_codon:yes stop_codon:yes gene_type:complete